jgi:membrane fusion protein, heavy metal efflux system
MKKSLTVLALFLLGAGAGLIFVTSQRAEPPATPVNRTPARSAPATSAKPGLCAAHGVPPKDCPWCDESLVESKGHCGGHDVPEAFCSRCNATLIPGFKALGDWCAGHGLPESQCKKCQGGDLPPGKSPQDTKSEGFDPPFCRFHEIAEAECPWCDESLIESNGHCRGHDVPEALCSRCNPALIPGFKAEDDWCAGHGLPESQCKKCQAGELPPGEQRAEESK